MKKKLFFGLALGVGISLAAFFSWGLFQELARRTVQDKLNQNQHDLFAGSLQLGRLSLDPKLRIHLRRIQAELQTPHGPVPLEIKEIETLNPFYDFLFKGGLLHFEDLKPLGSSYPGVQGTIRLQNGAKGFYEVEAKVLGWGLEELRWMDPVNLEGATGSIKGQVRLRQGIKGETALTGRFYVEQPGGKIAARLFDVLLPYLPYLEKDERIQQIRARGGAVGFRDASLLMEMKESDPMKFFVHVWVPDYNLNLNVDLKVRLDVKDAFLQLADLLGALKENQRP